MAVHIILEKSFRSWNSFEASSMRSLCGVEVQREEGRWTAPWTEFPCGTNPDKVCPDCRESPEYALILLAGEV